MTRSRVASALMAAFLTASLTACGGNDEAGGLPTLSGSTSSPASSTPSSSAPSPTPTAVPTQTVGKYRDFTLVLRRPATVDPKTEPAIMQFQKVHQVFATMAGGSAAPAELPKIANPLVVKYLNDILATDRKAKQRSGGTLTVSVTKATASAKLAVVDGCFNQSKVVTIRTNGSRFVDPSIGRNPTFPVRVTLSADTGIWKISEYVLRDGKC